MNCVHRTPYTPHREAMLCCIVLYCIYSWHYFTHCKGLAVVFVHVYVYVCECFCTHIHVHCTSLDVCCEIYRKICMLYCKFLSPKLRIYELNVCLFPFLHLNFRNMKPDMAYTSAHKTEKNGMNSKMLLFSIK